MVKKPLISKIQRYSTKDGPGIRTTVFFVGCNLLCPWCSNPELIGRQRKILHYNSKCQRCGRCVKVGKGAVTLSETGISIDRANCDNYEEISASCPYEAYEIIGHYYQAQELVDELLKDEVFFKESKGGVSFSGGEAALYPEYLEEVANILKKRHIHLVLDTAGQWQFSSLKTLLAAIDIVLYDIKAFDNSLHKRLLGMDNELIIKNLHSLVKMKKEVIMRLPLIPGVNDDLDDIKQRLALANELQLKQVDILYYHNLGQAKYKALGLDYPLANTGFCSEEFKNEVAALAKTYNFKTTFSE